jgi:2-polyprenyl-6-methoxyphenol hydroxylase-like FAD-dependent oxidoreductase
MEIFRRLGMAKEVRETGLPAHYPADVAFRTTATGIEFGRISIPCRAARYTSKEGPDTWWPTPEPPHRSNQIYLEPVMFDYAKKTPGLRLLHRTSLTSFAQSNNGVVATTKDLVSETAHKVCAQYLIGCDGAHSGVRRQIETKMSGDGHVVAVQSTYIRSPDLLGMMRSPAWATDCMNPRACALVFAIDGHERWLIHRFLKPGESAMTADRDRGIRDVLGVNAAFEYEILGREDWIGKRLVADRFRDRHAFLCGDAAHIWVPMAGYGMNAGIADAMDLSWMLAGVLKGWADPALLDAYEIERRPITDQVSRYAMNNALARTAQQVAIPDAIDEPGLEGDAVRARLGREVYDLNVGAWCCGGLNFGYFYDASPVVAYDGEVAPVYTMYDFVQSTVPGCRTPHLWLRDGRSLYDALGPDFTLLRFDPTAHADALVAAADRRGLPLAVLDVDADQAAALYPCKLLLSRPDRHVAWRGDTLPADSLTLIDLVRGAAVGQLAPTSQR